MTNPTKFEQTHIEMVLDRSGSMGTCRSATIDAVNKYLQEARQDTVMKEADFSLTIFDTQSIDNIRSGVVINIKDITAEDFQPRGGTPLYDAIGRGIGNLDGKLAAAGTGKAILVIVTDGEENSSRKYNHSSISELIKARQDAGWLVVFLGAGLGAARQGLAMGINAGTTANIAMDEQALGATVSSVYAMNSSYSAKPQAEAKAFAMRASFSAAERKLMGDTSGGSSLLGKTPPQQTPSIPRKEKKAEDAFDASADTWSN